MHNWDFIQRFSLQVARRKYNCGICGRATVTHLKVSYNNKCFESLDTHSKPEISIQYWDTPFTMKVKKKEKNHLFNFKVLFKREHPRTNIFIILSYSLLYDLSGFLLQEKVFTIIDHINSWLFKYLRLCYRSIGVCLSALLFISISHIFEIFLHTDFNGWESMVIIT